MERLGIQEGEHIESRIVTRAVENAQKRLKAYILKVENICLSMMMWPMNKERPSIVTAMNF